jgi:hypothetical protein
VADKYGPDWWPDFGWKRGIMWVAQGFVLPWLITSAVFVTGFLWGWVRSGFSDVDAALQSGRLLIMLGFILGGGGLSLSIASHDGLRWRTFLRIVGVTFGMVAYWELLLPVLLPL